LNDVQLRSNIKEDESDLDFEDQGIVEYDAFNLMYRNRRKYLNMLETASSLRTQENKYFFLGFQTG
jgi:hypothetical protein